MLNILPNISAFKNEGTNKPSLKYFTVGNRLMTITEPRITVTGYSGC